MSKTSDPELETDDNPQEEIIEIEGDSLEAITEEKSLVISEDIFPGLPAHRTTLRSPALSENAAAGYHFR